MSSTIQIKRSTANATPANLQAGELAYSYVSNTLFIGDTAGGVIDLFSNTSFSSGPAYNQANLAYAEANVANLLATSANTTATLAYTISNAALPALGGTITGSLLITQNLTVDGAVTMTIDGGSF